MRPLIITALLLCLAAPAMAQDAPRKWYANVSAGQLLPKRLANDALKPCVNFVEGCKAEGLSFEHSLHVSQPDKDGFVSVGISITLTRPESIARLTALAESALLAIDRFSEARGVSCNINLRSTAPPPTH